nr:uncharacterized protein LOC131280353 [Dasypus novemcinctus]
MEPDGAARGHGTQKHGEEPRQRAQAPAPAVVEPPSPHACVDGCTAASLGQGAGWAPHGACGPRLRCALEAAPFPRPVAAMAGLNSCPGPGGQLLPPCGSVSAVLCGLRLTVGRCRSLGQSPSCGSLGLISERSMCPLTQPRCCSVPPAAPHNVTFGKSRVTRGSTATPQVCGSQRGLWRVPRVGPEALGCPGGSPAQHSGGFVPAGLLGLLRLETGAGVAGGGGGRLRRGDGGCGPGAAGSWAAREAGLLAGPRHACVFAHCHRKSSCHAPTARGPSAPGPARRWGPPRVQSLGPARFPVAR